MILGSSLIFFGVGREGLNFDVVIVMRSDSVFVVGLAWSGVWELYCFRFLYLGLMDVFFFRGDARRRSCGYLRGYGVVDYFYR